ncbi:MAG: alkaline phosphatase family protein, partial [Armatimonadetes bacterium]|nr:alkaline phosphatase family protein [Armatimonadota bacterium]
MAASKLKLVVYGIDSADWAVIEPLLEAGDLPNLAAVLSGGARAVVRSTIPPITAVAWPTAFTGTNPGRHGLFGFVLTGQRPTLLSNADRRRPALWQILSAAGLRVGCFLLPFTYPPDVVEGWMLSGTGGDSWGPRSVQPEELYPELEPLLQQYPSDVLSPVVTRTPGALERAWQRLSDWRAGLLEHLLDKHPVDVLIAVDNATDVLQHKFLVSRSLGEGEDMVAWAYRHADRLLGLIRQHTDADTRFLLLSDHGAQPLAGYIDVSAWLAQEG